MTEYFSLYKTFLPKHLHIPGFLPSIHIALYLPTAGKEAEFLLEMSRLKFFIDQDIVEYPNTSIFIRGDANSSKTNNIRNAIFTTFTQDYSSQEFHSITTHTITFLEVVSRILSWMSFSSLIKMVSKKSSCPFNVNCLNLLWTHIMTY